MRSGVGVLMNIVTCSTGNHFIKLLDLHRWNAGISLKIQIWLSTILFRTFLSIPSSYARMSGYRHPSSFSFRIKRPCTHWNSWFHPFKIEHTRNTYPAIKYTQKRRFSIYFHSQPLRLRSHPISTSFSLPPCVLNDKMSLQKVTFWQC